ncbi:uncharacterized protein Tco025E_04931 [Trypanosoma conorhini]|uniref:Vacuolar protein sorting-associated protein VTA1 n=1 Tax=Trypanosoma conorhini TaxID=83891 RepID=A0A3R7MLR0_9TRYP|nr:uncharacterized protein Tco025E_04931 [Trypanosoma conorhini]RNF17253.1 hypothetical protein Tco025E_04931 [Trypanosoma conorhini]
MSSSLTESVPEHWVATLRPYLQRADEFEKLQPVVAYFLRTHVANLALRQRRKEDHAGTQFLRQLLQALEGDKQRLGPAVAEADGRTVLTKTALALFARADDAERGGAPADMGLVRLFFTASILLDATGQFAENGELDPIAAKRRDYARYIAVRMKRALESGTPYESPNAAAAASSEGGGEAASDDAGDAKEARQQQQQQPLFPAAELRPPPPEPFAPNPTPSPPPPPYEPFRPPAPPASVTAPGGSSGGGGPSMDAMINAQKCAKQAVSALQFYDHATARKQLISALNFLGQQ